MIEEAPNEDRNESMMRVLTISSLVLISALCASGADAVTFKHIVVIFQENRTIDNLFGSNPTFESGVDIARSGLNSKGQTVPLTAVPLASCYGEDHSHTAFVQMYDTGKMDGADKITPGPNPGCKVPPNSQFKYVDNSTGTVQPYFDLATQYGFANRMFQSNQGPSFPAHQFIFGGTSAPTTNSVLFASENSKDLSEPVGCTAPSNQSVRLIDPRGSETTNPPIYPCFEHPVLPDLLDAASISWRYYSPGPNGIWVAPNAIRHVCVPMLVNGKLTCTGADWKKDFVPNQAQVLTDIKNCKLAGVSWIIPDGDESDHAPLNNGTGPAWVASIVNAIGNNPACAKTSEVYWNDTAIFITWDDWGGWYDHVPPYRIGQSNGWGSGYVYGFRVPLLVVSAYTPAGYVDNDTHDFGSILRFAEANFGLGLVGPGYYADAYADDLAEFFSLIQPRTYKAIASKLAARYFIHKRLSGIPPDDD